MGEPGHPDNSRSLAKDGVFQLGWGEVAALLGEQFAGQFYDATRITKEAYGERMLYEIVVGDRKVVVEASVPGEIEGTSNVYIQDTTKPEARIQKMTVNPHGAMKIGKGELVPPDAVTTLRKNLSSQGQAQVTRFTRPILPLV